LGDAVETDPSEAERLVLGVDCRLTARLRHLSRMIAVEEAAGLPHKGPVFIRFDTKDLGAGGLTETVAQLRDLLSPDRRLILEMPCNAACNPPLARELQKELQALDAGLACYDFTDLSEKGLRRMERVPEFLLLAKSVVRGIDNHSPRQRQLQTIISAVRDLGGEIIATGLNTPRQVELCREWGCHFGQGTCRAGSNS
jgi:EAL domain-containing protein (putative c-di-GMP-specific phosphodiesterase class I)